MISDSAVTHFRKQCEKGPVLRCRLVGLSSIPATLQQLAGQNTSPHAWSPLLLVTNGRRCLPTCYVPAAVPFVIRRPWSSSLGQRELSGGVALSKLSKPLNQENAWASPGYAVKPLSAGAPLAGRTQVRGGRNPSICFHFIVCSTRIIIARRRRCLPGGGGGCTGRVDQCKAKQGRRGKTALT